MPALIAIFIGGGAGSLARYAFSKWLNSDSSVFPLGTFTSNIIACFILGLLIAYSLKNDMSNSVKLLAITGFCGGFSTFSTFSLENFELLQAGQYASAFLYTIISFITGMAAIFIGLKAFESWLS